MDESEGICTRDNGGAFIHICWEPQALDGPAQFDRELKLFGQVGGKGFSFGVIDRDEDALDGSAGELVLEEAEAVGQLGVQLGRGNEGVVLCGRGGHPVSPFRLFGQADVRAVADATYAIVEDHNVGLRLSYHGESDDLRGGEALPVRPGHCGRGGFHGYELEAGGAGAFLALLDIGVSGGGKQHAQHLLAVFVQLLRDGTVHGNAALGEDGVALRDCPHGAEQVLARHVRELYELSDGGGLGEEHDRVSRGDVLLRHEFGDSAAQDLTIAYLKAVEGSLRWVDVAESRDLDLTVGEAKLGGGHAFGREYDCQ